MTTINFEPIAVIGIGCRYADEAIDTENLWRILVQGRSAMKPYPADKFNTSVHYHPNRERGGTVRHSSIVRPFCYQLKLVVKKYTQSAFCAVLCQQSTLSLKKHDLFSIIFKAETLLCKPNIEPHGSIP